MTGRVSEAMTRKVRPKDNRSFAELGMQFQDKGMSGAKALGQ